MYNANKAVQDEIKDAINKIPDLPPAVTVNKTWTLPLIKTELPQYIKSTSRNEDSDRDLFSAIVKLIKGSSTNQDGLRDSIDDIVKLISATKAVTEALQVVVYLCRNDGTTKGTQSVFNVEFLGKAGICEVLTTLLKQSTSIKSQDIAEYGCRAILCLTANTEDENRGKFGTAGACEVVNEILKQFGKTNADICKYGCIAIYNLTFHGLNKENFKKYDAKSLLKELEVVYKNNKPVLEEIKDSIKQLS